MDNFEKNLLAIVIVVIALVLAVVNAQVRILGKQVSVLITTCQNLQSEIDTLRNQLNSTQDKPIYPIYPSEDSTYDLGAPTPMSWMQNRKTRN